MENNIKLLEKPIFFRDFKNGLIAILAFIFGVIPSFIPELTKKTFLGIQLNWLILFGTIIVTFLAYAIIYNYKVQNFYNNYKNQFKEFKKIKQNNESLKKQFINKQKELNNLNNILEEYDYIIDSMMNSIKLGACYVSNDETEFLNELYSILLKDREHLLKFKKEENI